MKIINIFLAILLLSLLNYAPYFKSENSIKNNRFMCGGGGRSEIVLGVAV